MAEEIDKQLKCILSHIEKLKKEIEQYFTKKKSDLKKRSAFPILIATNDLAAIVGKKKITRQEAVKCFWDYVMSNKLQDSIDRRNIILDNRLKKVFGNKKQVSQFAILGMISKNLKKSD